MVKKNIIDSAKTFNNDKIVLINVNNTSIILDNMGERILEDYTVSKEIKNNDGDTLYLVIKDVKNNLFYYFDIDKKEIIGDNFQNYSEKDDKGNLIITKVKNNALNKFILDKNGNQKKYTEKNTQKYANDIKMLIDSSKYYVYDNSVYKENQNNVFVNKKDNTIISSIGKVKDEVQNIDTKIVMDSQRKEYISNSEKIDITQGKTNEEIDEIYNAMEIKQQEKEKNKETQIKYIDNSR